MTQKFLDRAQIGPALEQMGRERVPQRVRVDAALERCRARPDAQAAAHVGGRQTAAGCGDGNVLVPKSPHFKEDTCSWGSKQTNDDGVKRQGSRGGSPMRGEGE